MMLKRKVEKTEKQPKDKEFYSFNEKNLNEIVSNVYLFICFHIKLFNDNGKEATE